MLLESAGERMSEIQTKTFLHCLSVFGLIACACLAVWAWQSGLLTSQQAMSDFVQKADFWGPALFLILQAVQVVIPILPGGISCLAGVLIFGPWLGFLLSYLGICAGSMLAFLIARHFGRPVLECLFQQEQLARYDQWMQSHRHLSRWLAIAIFFPVAPDDLLCYLAGTTLLSWKTFTAIIWLCKPFSIALYSMFLMFGWTHLLSWLHLGGT